MNKHIRCWKKSKRHYWLASWWDPAIHFWIETLAGQVKTIIIVPLPFLHLFRNLLIHILQVPWAFCKQELLPRWARALRALVWWGWDSWHYAWVSGMRIVGASSSFNFAYVVSQCSSSLRWDVMKFAATSLHEVHQTQLKTLTRKVVNRDLIIRSIVLDAIRSPCLLMRMKYTLRRMAGSPRCALSTLMKQT